MPELHRLTPPLGVLQDRGFRFALVTDGRMSGASGKVLAAIQVTPEARLGGALALLRDGNLIRVGAQTSELTALVPQATLSTRTRLEPSEPAGVYGCGARAVRELPQPRRHRREWRLVPMTNGVR